MAKVIMVQGTMSNAGKSLLVAGLCRIFRQDGYRVAPFKSQNMALNSYITRDGLEMGRAQVMQAEAAGVEPSVNMNPILLKPTNDTGSQVIVGGEVVGNMSAREYFRCKRKLMPDIRRAFRELAGQSEIIVIEGAGSPAEINLKENDIVNMGLADMVDAPVLLVGDIDRGGVFAQLLGTLLLLEPGERARVEGLIINKFRGDRSILEPGIAMLEERGRVPVTGVIPYMQLQIEDEDSLSERLNDKAVSAVIDIAVVRFPRLSNFTDMDVFAQIPEVSVRYVTDPGRMGHPDLVILPGSKNTMGDLLWMRQNGMEAVVKRLAASDTPIVGICGGFQMLGMEIADEDGVEEGGALRGMELLAARTRLEREKTRRQVCGRFGELSGVFASLSGREYRGYELHMGRTVADASEVPCQETMGSVPGRGRTDNPVGVVSGSGRGGDRGGTVEHTEDGALRALGSGNVYGTYVHGLFDHGSLAADMVRALAERKHVAIGEGSYDYADFKERQFDLLAEGIRANMNMEQVYGMLREAKETL